MATRIRDIQFKLVTTRNFTRMTPQPRKLSNTAFGQWTYSHAEDGKFSWDVCVCVCVKLHLRSYKKVQYVLTPAEEIVSHSK
jgi:hypothetical protein